MHYHRAMVWSRPHTLALCVSLAAISCTLDNPAFDSADEGAADESSDTKSEIGTSEGDGDTGEGDADTGDGDGDGDTGDGDTGEGDGDGDTGDGDGDTGDGDTGDGDTDEGDGDTGTSETSTGDGDGDSGGNVTCDELLELYMSTASQASACEPQQACHVVDGHCGVGLGGCYHFVTNTDVQLQLDEIAQMWQALECGGLVCACAPPPVEVGCVEGVCMPL